MPSDDRPREDHGQPLKLRPERPERPATTKPANPGSVMESYCGDPGVENVSPSLALLCLCLSSFSCYVLLYNAVFFLL